MIVAVQIPERMLAFDYIEEIPLVGEVVEFADRDYMVVGRFCEAIGGLDFGLETLKLEPVGMVAW